MKRFSVLAVLLLFTTLATGTIRTTLDDRAAHHGEDEPIYLPHADLLRPLTLGYHNAFADVLWFRTINYFGKHYRGDRNYRWLSYMCDLVTDLDPLFEDVYEFGGVILPWEAGDVDGGLKLLAKGTAAIQDSWLLEYYLGFSHFYFRGDKATAAKHLATAAQLPDAHATVANLAAILTRESSGPEATLAFLSSLEKGSGATNLRSVIEKNLVETAAESAIVELNEAVDSYYRSAPEPLLTLERLVEAGVIDRIPRDPFGGRFILGTDGKVRSSTGMEPSRTHAGPAHEQVGNRPENE